MTLSAAFDGSTLREFNGAIWYPDGTTSADIQDAIDAAIAAGGGTVELGNSTYVCTTQINLDPTLVSLVGHGATLDSTTGSSSLILLNVESLLTSPTRGHSTRKIEGLKFRGAGSSSTQVAMRLFTSTNSSDRSSKAHVRNCDIQDFKYGVEVRQNAFVSKFYSVDIRNCTNCVRTVSGETNRGESIAFFGCTMGAATIIVNAAGHSVDMYFHGCSFDFPTNSFIYTDDKVHCFGCHFEDAPPGSNNWCFQVDNNGFIFLFGGLVGFSSGSGAGTLFQQWGQGGKFRLYGVNGNVPTGVTVTNAGTDFYSDTGSSTAPFHL